MGTSSYSCTELQGELAKRPHYEDTIILTSYYFTCYLFILALGGLSHQTTSKRGNWYGVMGMLFSLVITMLAPNFYGWDYIKFVVGFFSGGFIGAILGSKVEMIKMPQMVALLHTFVGIAATMVGWANYGKEFYFGEKTRLDSDDPMTKNKVETWIGIWIGAITFTGSVVACGKLNGNIRSSPLMIGGSFRHWLNLFIMIAVIGLCPLFVMTVNIWYLVANTVLSLFLGWHLIMAIGGADMPVVISMLNSYSGWATSFSGFLLNNQLLIISGALIGSSGAILSFIMCRGMNRNFVAVIMGGFGIESEMSTDQMGELKEGTMDEFIDDLIKAKSIICTPGYGMAVSRAQKQVGELMMILKKMGKTSRFCIHPVAGRLPGHMNVLLAEANVPYDIVYEMEKINEDFNKTDVVLVVGANDTVNPDALENPKSPIAGMPVCEVWKSKKVYVNKRGKGLGYSGIVNTLFGKPNTRMFYGDAATKMGEVVMELQKRGLTKTVIAKEVKEEKTQEEVVEKLSSQEIAELLNNCSQVIGVPKEVEPLERRVALTPSVCLKLLKLGFKIKVEEGAGVCAQFSDEQYKACGAEIVSTKELWENSQIIMKIRAPYDNPKLGKHESEALSNTQLLVSFIYPDFNQTLVEKLQSKSEQTGLTVFAMDKNPRITRSQKLDTLSSQTNLTGYRATIEAFSHLPRYSRLVVSAAGSIQPAKVFVLGCGVAGLAAIGVARSMGAIVKGFDSRSVVKEQIESLGAEFVELDYEEEGAGKGGYGQQMSEAYYAAQRKMISEICKEMDIVITTALIPGKKAPTLVYEEAVRNMRQGSVIVDLAAEMGGNCVFTRKGEIYVDSVSKVKIIGFYDYTSRMANQSSELFAMNMWHLVGELIGKPKNPNNTAKEYSLNLQDEIQDNLAIIHKGAYRYGDKLVAEEQKKRAAAAIVHKPVDQPQQQKKEVNIAMVELTKLKQEEKQNEKSQLLSKEDKPVVVQQEGCCQKPWMAAFLIFLFGLIPTLLIGWTWGSELTNQIGIFALAIFTGYLVIWNVTPSLHTPLMSETNAISGVIVVGAMNCMGERVKERCTGHEFEAYSIIGFIALTFASINIWGGFIVTHRMLAMFRLG